MVEDQGGLLWYLLEGLVSLVLWLTIWTVSVAFSVLFGRVMLSMSRPSILKPKENSLSKGKSEEKDVTLFIGSWNLFDQQPQNLSWISEGYDIYVIGSQECGYETEDQKKAKAWEKIFYSCEEDWFKRIADHLGPEYTTVMTHSIRDSIRIIVSARTSIYPNISNIECFQRVIGFPIFSKKGGVGVAMDINDTKVCFMNVHLPPRAPKWIGLTAAETLRWLRLGEIRYEAFLQYDHFFLLGDLNFRVDGKREEIAKFIEDKDWDQLTERDSLKKEQKSTGTLEVFQEGKLAFRPTYKYELGSSTEYMKNRIPSYCDRVLFSSRPNHRLRQKSYGASHDITSSDHHPLFATFIMETKIFKELDNNQSFNQFYVLLTDVKAEELKVDFVLNRNFLELYTPFLNDRTKFFSHDNKSHTELEWKTVSFSTKPTNFQYLSTQFLLLTVFNTGLLVNEMIGSALVAFPSKRDESVPFSTDLIARGSKVGTISGNISIQPGLY
eukprot:TRINITY_DN3457_c0_g1_i1.p1 TRINITY_DN3457_c0_g1~~TRINITY_DN3457_c0_g1_i1.p1  ORF type:complete len:496 (+),score=127.08 TRINITY_DN3457_c0_g1_i1:48-1535(+)